MAALLAAHPVAPDLSQPTPLSEVLRNLSQKLGVSLTASSDLAQRIIILKKEDELGSLVLPLIARATCGKWEDVEGGKRLVIDSERRKEEEREFSDRFKKGLEQALQELVPKSQQSDGDAAAEALLKRIEALAVRPQDFLTLETAARYAGLFPADVLCSNLLASLGANRLLRLKSGQHAVYCTLPAEGELTFPPEAQRALGAFRDVQERLAKLLESRAPPAGSESAWRSLAADARSIESSLQVILVVSRAGDLFGARCEVFSEGENCGTGFCRVEPAIGADSLQPAVDRVALTERSQLARSLHLAGLRGQFMGPEQPTNEQQSDLLSVAEPLRFFVPEAVSALHDGPIVACLPDLASGLAFRASTESTLDLRLFASNLQKRCVSFERVGKCLVVKPLAPSLASGQQDLRKAIKTDLLEHRNTKFVPATDYLQYNGLAERVGGAMSFSGVLFPSLLHAAGWRTLRWVRVFPSAYGLLSGLTSRQLDALGAGGRIAIESLSPLQQAAAREWLRSDVYTPSPAPFSRAGIRRLDHGGTWFLELEIQRPVSLVARSGGAYDQWLSRLPWSLENWKERFDNFARETKTSSELLGASAEWWAVEPEHWSFSIHAEGVEGVEASFSWSLPGPAVFRKWHELGQGIRQQVIPPN